MMMSPSGGDMWTGAVVVTVDVNAGLDEYRFDYSSRTVERVVGRSGAADVSQILSARLDIGTVAPRLVGRQTDEFRGVTDSWEAGPDSSAAVCEDIGLIVTDWASVTM